MRKLLVLPEFQQALGGSTVSLSLMIKGFERCGISEQVCVLVMENTLLEQYLRRSELAYCMQLIQGSNRRQFLIKALQWVAKQPHDWPLLLDSCVSRKVLTVLAQAAPSLRLSGRPTYHFFHDLAYSYNLLGNLGRKFTFTFLSPRAICNSQFTAQHVRKSLMPKIEDILYQPVDTELFCPRLPTDTPPENLQPLLDSGAKIMLTPSRISEPGIANDKNLRGLIPVLAQLKQAGYYYHGVIIGQDFSEGKARSRALLEQAKKLGVADRLTILPPTFAIENYYKFADIVVTLAPREPFGRIVVEAIACGVPAIGSKTGGIGEILRHFAPQWTVDPHDSVAVARAITCVANDSNTYKLLAQGKKWVEKRCSPAEYAQRIMQITRLNSLKTHSVQDARLAAPV